MITLKTGKTVLKINEMGAEMKSFTVGGTEYLWTGDPDIWAASAPNIFPMTGGFRDDKYLLNGKEYHMNKHGFAKNMMFEVEEATDDSAVFVLRSNGETMVSFPFDFEFRVCYRLFDGKIEVDYKVLNASDKTMWFSVGSHDGFACPEGIEQYDVVFPQKETLNSYTLFGNLISDENVPIIKNSDKIALKYDYFAVDALVFKDVRSNSCKLVNRDTGRGIEIAYADAPFLILWTKPGAPYLCIEPWYGVADKVDSDYDITRKEGIQSIKSGETFISTRVINALEGK